MYITVKCGCKVPLQMPVMAVLTDHFRGRTPFWRAVKYLLLTRVDFHGER